jgi:hypothetical protein
LLVKSATRRFRVPSQQPKREVEATALCGTRGDVQTDTAEVRRRHSGRAQAPRRSAGCRTDRAATMNDLLSSVKVRASARA